MEYYSVKPTFIKAMKISSWYLGVFTQICNIFIYSLWQLKLNLIIKKVGIISNSFVTRPQACSVVRGVSFILRSLKWLKLKYACYWKHWAQTVHPYYLHQGHSLWSRIRCGMSSAYTFSLIFFRLKYGSPEYTGIFVFINNKFSEFVNSWFIKIYVTTSIKYNIF